jgi:AcrR family transcriptional regulator
MPHRSVPAAMPLNGHTQDDQPASWQARKNASTRLQIIEATLRCFSRLGGFSTTAPAIAAEAGLSRGAMLHHFPSRQDLIRAAVERLHATFIKRHVAAPETDSLEVSCRRLCSSRCATGSPPSP